MLDFFEMKYLDIIAHYIELHSHKKGFKSALSRAAKIQQSYLSQVLAGSVHITPDQAVAFADFFGLDERRKDYFITRVNFERASTQTLKDFLQAKLDNIRQLKNARTVQVENLDLKFRDAVVLHSTWEYWSVYAAIQIPRISTLASLASFISLTVQRVETIITELGEMGLIRRQDNWWVVAKPESNVYMQGGSAIGQIFMRTLDAKAQYQSLSGRAKFRGGIYPMSTQDYNRLTEKIVEAFNSIETKPSVGENSLVAGVSLHLFKI